MWAYENVFYQIYPLGMCGAPFENDGVQEHRILKVLGWIDHLKRLGVGAVLFNPVFESDTHGYNTRDYRRIDTRLGTNEDFKRVCDALHEAGIRVVLDGVFNHVGRGFYGFQDVLKNRESSRYAGWFHISFDGNDAYDDGLWYDGWEGNYDLVKLNLQNPEVTDYLIDCVRFWIDTFGIDGLRLDVAYCLDRDFIRRLRAETASMKEDFYLVGEMIGGDYRTIMADDLCHSATNYECYKGMYSSFNSMNMFEILYSLNRQFGKDPWDLYTGMHLLNFADNHDVTRIASCLTHPEHLKLLYTMLFTIPGIPCLYYGSEWGVKGDKSQGDPALRPAFDQPEWNELTEYIAGLAHIFSGSRALHYGDFTQLALTNRQCVYRREADGERLIIAINADSNDYTAWFDAGAQTMHDLLTDQDVSLQDGLKLPAFTAMILR